MNHILIAVIAILSLGMFGGGGYYAVNALVDQKVAKLEADLIAKDAALATLTGSTASESPKIENIPPTPTSTSVVQLPTKPSVPVPAPKVSTEPVIASPKPQAKTFTTPSGAVIDEAGNVISGPTGSSVPTPIVTVGQSVLSGEDIYAAISPSVVLVQTSSGYGTGFVIENGKYTLTNAHVVGMSKTVTLRFSDGRTTQAPVLGRSEANDVAVVFNNGFNYKSVSFGSSESPSLSAGSDVYALGFPLNLITTVTLTKGIVSALRQPKPIGDLIQTDAAINPGNSGGPLVNNKGQVIGINTLGEINFNFDQLASGIGFAVPIERAKGLIPSLSQYGQSRYELHPIGSTLTIKRSVVHTQGLNDNLPCSALGFSGADLTMCEYYRAYYNDYKWNVIEDQ